MESLINIQEDCSQWSSSALLFQGNVINGILSQFSLKYAFAATAESDNCGMTQQTHSCSFKYIHQKYKYDHEKAKEPCTRVRAQVEQLSFK